MVTIHSTSSSTYYVLSTILSAEYYILMGNSNHWTYIIALICSTNPVGEAITILSHFRDENLELTWRKSHGQEVAELRWGLRWFTSYLELYSAVWSGRGSLEDKACPYP